MDKQHQRKLLDDSFNKSYWFNKSYCAGKYSEEFNKLYETMAPLISELDFDGCFVDLSNSRQLIDFNLSYSNGLFVSVARPFNVEDDVYFFSVSMNKETLIIDRLEIINQTELLDLISRLKNVECLLKKSQPSQPQVAQ